MENAYQDKASQSNFKTTFYLENQAEHELELIKDMLQKFIDDRVCEVIPVNSNNAKGEPISMVRFVARNLQNDTDTYRYCTIFSKLMVKDIISNFTLDISSNENVSKLKSMRNGSLLLDIGRKTSRIKNLEMFVLKVQKCNIDDDSFIILIDSLDFTKIPHVKFELEDNEISDLGLEKLLKCYTEKKGEPGFNIRYIEMILCKNSKVTDDWINKNWQAFGRCYIQKGLLRRGKKEQELNPPKKDQEEKDNSQISTVDKSDPQIIPENNRIESVPRNDYPPLNEYLNSSLDEDEAKMTEYLSRLSTHSSEMNLTNSQRGNGLNSTGELQSEVVDKALDLSNQNRESD